MLPLRVRLSQMLETASNDPGVLRRLIGLCTVLVVVAGVVASGGFSLHFEIGDRDEAALATGVPAAGQTFGDDGEPLVEGGAGSVPAGGGVAGSTAPGGRAAGGSTASAGGAAGGGGAGERPAAGGGDPEASAASTPSCEGAALRATDNGVTEDTITISLLQTDLAALDAAGFGLQTGETDYPKIIKAWENHFNASGGVACRKVVIRYDKTDLTIDGQLASCKQLTQDIKVHAVITPGGLVGGAPCITKDNKTPLVAALAAPNYWASEGAPYLWDVLMSQERVQLNHVQWLHDAKKINTKDTHVGVVYVNEPYGGPSVEGAMVPKLKELGYKVRVAKLPADAEQATAQMAQVVLDFQQAGVNHVMMPMNIIGKTQFMQQAESQQYFPEYSEDDATVGCQDFLTGTYPERSWDQTLCVGAGLLNGAPNGLRPADLQAYYKANPFAQKADAIYLATNEEGYDRGGEAPEEDRLAQQATNYHLGQLFSLWAQAANRVGPDLTRAAWGAAMEQTGAFGETVSPTPYTFGRGKWSGPDFIEIVQWHAAASDGYGERLWRRASDRIKAPF